MEVIVRLGSARGRIGPGAVVAGGGNGVAGLSLAFEELVDDALGSSARVARQRPRCVRRHQGAFAAVRIAGLKCDLTSVIVGSRRSHKATYLNSLLVIIVAVTRMSILVLLQADALLLVVNRGPDAHFQKKGGGGEA